MWQTRSALCLGVLLVFWALLAEPAWADIEDPYVDVLRLIENDLAEYTDLCSAIGNTGMSTLTFAVTISEDLSSRLEAFKLRFIRIIAGDPGLLDLVFNVAAAALDLAGEVAALNEFILTCKDRLSLLSEQLRRVLDLPFIPRPRRTR